MNQFLNSDGPAKSKPFNPDAPTQEYPRAAIGRIVKEIPAATQYEDLAGGLHSSYANAYKASIKTKLARIIRQTRGEYGYGGRDEELGQTSDYIAEEILKELTVSWP